MNALERLRARMGHESAEPAHLAPPVPQGGCVASADHSIPPGVSYGSGGCSMGRPFGIP